MENGLFKEQGINMVGKKKIEKIAFSTRLYSVVAIQDVISISLIILSTTDNLWKSFFLENFLFIWFSLITIILTLFLSIYSRSLFKKSILLQIIIALLFSVSKSVLLSYISLLLSDRLIMTLCFMEFCLVSSLIIHLISSNNELETISGLQFLVGLSIIFLIVFTFFSEISFVFLVISALWMVTFGSYLIYDTQLILNEDDFQNDHFIFYSVRLYSDSICLFLSTIEILYFIKKNEKND